MDKFEYGDLNRFVVSLGLALILGSIGSLWLFLREPFDLGKTVDQLQKLTPVAREVILHRQELTAGTMRVLPYISGAGFACGAILMLIGIRRWAPAHRVQERIQQKTLEKLIYDVKQAKQLANKVQAQMQQAGVDLVGAAEGRNMDAVVVEQLRPLVAALNKSVESIRSTPDSEEAVHPDALRTLAQGELALGNWVAASAILAEYARQRPEDFEANFSRGVAFANSRQGQPSNVNALRAYNDAVAYMPTQIDPNLRARLFTYRGAMLKRMGRFDEALADFGVARKFATAQYEAHDLVYNLASTYALMHDRERMMATIREATPDILEVIRARLDDYFSHFRHDREFLEIIGVRPRT